MLQLLYGVLVALPLVVFRLVYGAVPLMLELNHPNSSFLTSTVAKVLLSTVPEMIVAIILLAVGISTRKMYKGLRKWRRVEPESVDLMERKQLSMRRSSPSIKYVSRDSISGINLVLAC